MVRRVVIAVTTALVVLVLALDVLAAVGGPDDGPVGLAQVLAEHLTLLALVAIPVAFLHEARTLRVALVALVVLTVLRFGGEWWSLPSGAAEGEATLPVMTWNLEMGGQPPDDAVAFLRGSDARLVALQELTPSVSAAIAADPALARRYPFQALYPSPDVLGLGLLSTDPLSDIAFDPDPSRLTATVASPVGSVRVVDVHPLHGALDRGPLGIPLRYDVAGRAVGLARIRDAVATDQRGTTSLVLGDINTAPTEPAFGRFLSALSGIDPSEAAGFRDAHAEVGLGPGWTYRPDMFEPLGIGLIRIDVVLAGPGLRPVAETTRCPSLGDHCAVLATVVGE